MAVQASQLIARVSTEGVDTAKSQLQGMGQSVKDVSSSLGGGGLFGAVTGAVGGLLDFGAKVGQTIFGLQNLASGAVSLASNLLGPAVSAETMQTAFETLMGSTKAAKDEMQKLDTFASKTPFQTMDIDKAASQLIGFGAKAQDVVPDLTAIGDALSAVGRGSAANLNSVVNIFGKIQTEGKLTDGTMQEMSVNGINAWAILEQQTGKTKDELTKMMQQGLIPASDGIKMLTDGIEKNPLYAGGMAKQSNTMTGLISTLKSNWDQMLASFGSPILKGLEPIIGNIGNMLSSSAFKDFAGSIGQGIVGAFQGIGNAASYVGNIFKSLNLSSFEEAWKDMGVLLGGIEVRISRGLSPALKLLKTDADPIAAVIGNLAQGALSILNNILWSVESALLAVYKEMSSGKGPLIDFFNTAKSFLPDIQNIANLLGGQFKQAFQFAGESAKQVGGWFKTEVVPALKDAMPGFLSLAHTMTHDVIPAAIQIRGVIQEVVEHALSKFGPILGQIVPPLIRFAGILAKDVSEGLKFITPYVVEAAKELGKFADQIIDRVAPIVQEWIKNLTPLVQGFMSWWTANLPIISTIAEGVFQAIVGIVQIAWSIVSGIIKIGLDILSGNWGQAWTDMQNMLSGVFDGLNNIIDGGLKVAQGLLMGVGAFVDSHLVQPFRDALGTIGGIFGGIGKLISDATSGNWGAIPGDLNSIPHFAGGTDSAPGGVAVVGERGPELMYVPRGAVIRPASQTAQMMSGGTASGTQQPIILVMNDQIVARGLMPAIVSQIRNNVGVHF